MKHFERKIEEMTLQEAETAFGEATRNMSEAQIASVWRDTYIRSGDSEFVAVRKRLARRINSLKLEASGGKSGWSGRTQHA